MNALLWLLGGGLVLAAAGSKGASAGATQTYFVAPIAPPPPPPPGAPSGTQNLGDDAGRAWMTVPIDRNASIDRELSVAVIDDFGNGDIIADVYEQIEPPESTEWQELIACGVTRWKLSFVNGKLADAKIVGGVNGDSPVCFAGARPIAIAYQRVTQWVQRANEVVLKIETRSGIWKSGWKKPWGHCEVGGQCDKWDNDFVASGSVLIDVMWRVA
jgi:hypothetical protein